MATDLTRRELFAAMAMQGLLAYGETDINRIIPGGQYAGKSEGVVCAVEAVVMADFLIMALDVELCRHCNLPTSDNHYDKVNDLCSHSEVNK